MSSASSPGHRGGGRDFDGTAYYDPDYTVEISNKMRVPDKISVAQDEHFNGGHYDGQHNDSRNEHSNVGSSDWMRVPERILVAGGDKFSAGRVPLPEMRLESSFRTDNMNSEQVQLMTPPRHLTLNDHQYPTVEPENNLNSPERERRFNYKRTPAKDINFSPSAKEFNTSYGPDVGSPQDVYLNSFYTSHNNTIAGPADEMTMMKRQMKSLTRKVAAIERENQHRYQRDVIVYALGIVYLVMKGVSWLNRRW